MSAWTQDRVTHLGKLWSAGLTAAAIAAELGEDVSRNAVLAKVWRLGLARGGSHVGLVPRPRRSAAPRQPILRDAPLPSAPVSGSTSIIHVRRLQCRWPYGDPAQPGFSLCGGPVMRGAYCAAHAAAAYRARPVSAESLMRLAGVAS